MPLENTAHHRLEIRDLRFAVKLGVSEEERARPQEIGVTVELRFSAAPLGMLSDEIRDTICYAELAEALGRHYASREYKLVERLAGETYLVAKELARGTAEVAVKVNKLKPPVKNLLGGAVYSCGDFSP